MAALGALQMRSGSLSALSERHPRPRSAHPATSPSAFGAPATTSPFGSAPQPNAFNASPSGATPFGATSSPLRPQGAVFGGGGALGATGVQARA